MRGRGSKQQTPIDEYKQSGRPPCADSDDVGQAFQLMPDTDSNPKRTVIPMIPSRIVIDMAMGSGDAFGVKHDRLGGLFSE